jgi:hypothetical protein
VEGPHGRALDEVDDVVEALADGADLVPVEWRHERAMEVRDRLVEAPVRLVLDRLHGGEPRLRIPGMVELRPEGGDDLLRLLREPLHVLEEDVFLPAEFLEQAASTP